MQRLKRVFAIDIETCPDCGGRLGVIASIEELWLIRKNLGHVQNRENWVGVTTRGPPVTATPRLGSTGGGGRLRPLLGRRSKTKHSGHGEDALAGHVGEGSSDSRSAGLQCRVNRLSVMPA